MIIPKNINISWKKVCILRKFRAKIDLKRRALRDVIMAPSYDVTGKGARNCSKKCNVTCVILEKFLKWLYEREKSCDKYSYSTGQLTEYLTLPMYGLIESFSIFSAASSGLKRTYSGYLSPGFTKMSLLLTALPEWIDPLRIWKSLDSDFISTFSFSSMLDLFNNVSFFSLQSKY